MRKAIIYTLVFVLLSCGERRNSTDNNSTVPAALQDNNKSSSPSKKRMPQNLVDELYYDVVDKDSTLRKIEEQLAELPGREIDSTEVFKKFDSKNSSFYLAAKKYADALHDSILKMKIQALVDSSVNNYDLVKNEHARILNAINDKKTEIDDLHLILKIFTTTPIIEKFQKENIPSPKSMESYIKTLDSLITKLKKQVKL